MEGYVRGTDLALRTYWKVKCPFCGAWFPFEIRVWKNENGELSVEPSDQHFANGAIFQMTRIDD